MNKYIPVIVFKKNLTLNTACLIFPNRDKEAMATALHQLKWETSGKV